MLVLLLTLLTALAGTVPVLELRGGVDPATSEYLAEGIAAAEADDAPAVIIQVDTPGGLVESAREIVQAELNADVPVVVWVGPKGARAGSAGVFITAAGHIAAMAPGTHMGAAHPVSLFPSGGGAPDEEGSDEEADAPADDEVMEAKILEDTLAWARAIAEERGRNAEWIQAAVSESRSATASEALELGAIDLLAEDLPQLMEKVHGRTVELRSGPHTLDTAGAQLRTVPMSHRLYLLHLLSNPTVLMLLVGLGMAGLYAEFHNPGALYPAGLGVLCLVGAGIGLSVLPFNVAGLVLMVLGFGLFALEAYTPTFGGLTATGVIAVIFGGLTLFDVGGLDLRVAPAALIAFAVVAGALSLLLAWTVARDRREQVQTGSEGLVGLEGVVLTGGQNRGRVRVHGEIWNATWEGELEAGAAVQVTAVEGLTVAVEPAP